MFKSGTSSGASVRWSETVRQSKVSGTGCVLKAGVYNPYTMSRNIIVDGDETSRHSVDHASAMLARLVRVKHGVDSSLALS